MPLFTRPIELEELIIGNILIREYQGQQGHTDKNHND